LGAFLARGVFSARSRREEGRYLLVSVYCLTLGVTLHGAAAVAVAAETSPQQRLQPSLPMTRNERGKRVLDILNLHRPHVGGSARKDVFGLG
jgi:hypothetical protein